MGKTAADSGLGNQSNAEVTVSSSVANYQNHSVQRLYREAVVFAVSSQTTVAIEATLAGLVARAKLIHQC